MMSWIVEPERKIPVVAETDVLVCGGGFAGVAAAVCAARNGATMSASSVFSRKSSVRSSGRLPELREY